MRQKAFGRYIVDFYCASAKLVIELDGEVHDTVEAQAYDAVRTETLEARIARQVLSYEQEARGLRVLRFRNDLVLEELPEVVKKIKETPFLQLYKPYKKSTIPDCYVLDSSIQTLKFFRHLFAIFLKGFS